MKKIILGILVIFSIFLISTTLAQNGTLPIYEDNFLSIILDKITSLVSIQKMSLYELTSASKRECEWKSLNQKWDFNMNSWGTSRNYNITKTLQIPKDIPYSEVKISSGRIIARCSEMNKCTIFINRKKCLSPNENLKNENESNEINPPSKCLKFFNSGENKITLEIGANARGSFNNLYLEMEIKETKC